MPVSMPTRGSAIRLGWRKCCSCESPRAGLCLCPDETKAVPATGSEKAYHAGPRKAFLRVDCHYKRRRFFACNPFKRPRFFGTMCSVGKIRNGLDSPFFFGFFDLWAPVKLGEI